jgi:hypothetical protein
MALPLELEVLCDAHDAPARLSWRPTPMPGWSTAGTARADPRDLQQQPKPTRLSLLVSRLADTAASVF